MQSGEMLNVLDNALKIIPDYLVQSDKWSSLIVNRRKPHTYRVFTELQNNYRLCLHRFNPCDMHEAFFHPHPWPGAFKILSGSYMMRVGYSQDRVSQPEKVMTTIMTAGSSYEIINPLTWHAIVPLETTYTVMVNGLPWNKDVAHGSVRTTAGKDLDSMPDDELIEHLKTFQKLLGE